ncbi:hypothetical protein NC651_030790 [Populus alba x Populus x berolinensis]|nr:hypothetical protein NC651_030790 [Populus alba x Populus x berolinensis]
MTFWIPNLRSQRRDGIQGTIKPVTKESPCPLQIKPHNSAFLASSASTPTSSINPFCHCFI